MFWDFNHTSKPKQYCLSVENFWYSLWTKFGTPRSLNDINSKCIPVISTAKCSRTAIIYKLCDAFMLWFLLLIISYNLIFFRLRHDIFSLKKNLVVTSISKSNKILHPFWHKFYNSSIIYLLICMYIPVYIYLYDIYLGKKSFHNLKPWPDILHQQ